MSSLRTLALNWRRERSIVPIKPSQKQGEERPMNAMGEKGRDPKRAT